MVEFTVEVDHVLESREFYFTTEIHFEKNIYIFVILETLISEESLLFYGIQSKNLQNQVFFCSQS